MRRLPRAGRGARRRRAILAAILAAAAGSALAAGVVVALGVRRGRRIYSPRIEAGVVRGVSRRLGSVRRAALRPPGSPAYRWLVRTTGSPPTVAQENHSPGTRAWRLPGPRAYVGGLAHGQIEGYVSSQSLAPGQTERVYVEAPRARFITIRVFRMGWYGGMGGREVLASARLRPYSQPPCFHANTTGLTECDWHPTLRFKIPPALPSGVYIGGLSASTGAHSDVLFVVLSTNPAPLLAQLPTSTYEAYNSWGGDSLYPGGSPVKVTGTTQGVEVSYDRPYGSVTGAGQFFARGDVALVWFLERYGYPVSYTDSESVDQDPRQLIGHRALIDFGHSEYWSQREADAWLGARDRGTDLLFLGSDTMGWRVRFARSTRHASRPGTPDRVMIAYKEHHALDPDHRLPSGPFPDYGAPITGSAYVGCITARVNQPGPPTYYYYDWRPAPALRPRWLFAHTGITASTVMPGLTGYELDQITSSSPPGTELLGQGVAPCQSESADEPGEPSPGPGEHAADMTLYRARSGALVFNTGTLGWELGLEPVRSASPDAPIAPDPRVVAMTRNLLGYVLHSSRLPTSRTPP